MSGGVDLGFPLFFVGFCGGVVVDGWKRAWVCANLDLGVVVWWLTVGNGLGFASISILAWWSVCAELDPAKLPWVEEGSALERCS
uniref:Transmembrane protein n=1 Tax=Fagus sylvatica TaxID=28930 RepID=A0A2N9J595_FAGSY